MKNLKTVYQKSPYYVKPVEKTDDDFRKYLLWVMAHGVNKYPILLGLDKEQHKIFLPFFARDDLQQKYLQHELIFEYTDWAESQISQISDSLVSETKTFKGSIDRINKYNLRDQHIHSRSTQDFEVAGWITSDDYQAVDFVYVYVDDKPIQLAAYGIARNDILKNISSSAFRYSGWYAIIPEELIEDGCHTVTIQAIKDNDISKIFGMSEFCVKET